MTSPLWAPLASDRKSQLSKTVKPHCAPETQNPRARTAATFNENFPHKEADTWNTVNPFSGMPLYVCILLLCMDSCVDFNRNFGIIVHLILQCPIKLYLFLNAHLKKYDLRVFTLILACHLLFSNPSISSSAYFCFWYIWCVKKCKTKHRSPSGLVRVLGCLYRIIAARIGLWVKLLQKICWEVRNRIVSKGKFKASAVNFALCSNWGISHKILSWSCCVSGGLLFVWLLGALWFCWVSSRLCFLGFWWKFVLIAVWCCSRVSFVVIAWHLYIVPDFVFCCCGHYQKIGIGFVSLYRGGVVGCFVATWVPVVLLLVGLCIPLCGYKKILSFIKKNKKKGRECSLILFSNVLLHWYAAIWSKSCFCQEFLGEHYLLQLNQKHILPQLRLLQQLGTLWKSSLRQIEV